MTGQTKAERRADSRGRVGAALLIRGFGRLERFVEGDFAADGHLVRGDAAFEEVRELLDVLEFHEREGVLDVEARLEAEVAQALVGHELEVRAHVLDRHAGASRAGRW